MHTTILIEERNKAERAERESEQRYKRLLASVTDYVYSVTVDRGRPIATSHGLGCEAVTGYTSKELDADPFLWYDMIFSEDRPAVTAQADRVLRGETPPPLEHRIIRKDGSLCWIRNTAVPHKDDQGRLVGYDGLVSDITERKRAENAILQKSRIQTVTNSLLRLSLSDVPLEEILKQALDLLFDIPWFKVQSKGAVFLVEPNSPDLVMKAHRGLDTSVILECNRVPLGRCHCGKALLRGQVQFASDVDERHETRYEGMKPHGHYCVPIKAADQTLGVFTFYLAPGHPYVAEEEQFLVSTANVLAGIIQRKRAEETQARLVAILEETSDFVGIAKAPDFHILYVNHAGRKMIGVGQEEDLTRSAISTVHPEWANQMFRDEIIPTAIRDGLWRGDCAFRHRDGREIPVLMIVLAHKSPAGDIVHFSTISRDISERKLAEEQLLKAHAELTLSEAHLRKTLEELQGSHEVLKKTELQLIQAAKLESVGTLTAGVAHEVKNPLQIILMGLDYLDNNLPGGNDNNTALVLTDMRDAVTRANVIIRELLQLSAASDFEPKEEDLNSLMERSLRLINNEVIASKISVVRNLGAELPRVKLDHGKMEQVFINLFMNALHAMAQGGVLTVATRHHCFGEDPKLTGPAFSQFEPGEPIVIAEVQDTGKGIPEANLARIFDPFFTTKPTGVGTGLGLSVVKKILDLHGAAIEIRNAPPGGVLATLIFKAESEDRP